MVQLDGIEENTHTFDTTAMLGWASNCVKSEGIVEYAKTLTVFGGERETGVQNKER